MVLLPRREKLTRTIFGGFWWAGVREGLPPWRWTERTEPGERERQATRIPRVRPSAVCRGGDKFVEQIRGLKVADAALGRESAPAACAVRSGSPEA